MLISIDHGNKQIKTNHRTFVSGLRESDTKPPFGKDVLFYKGKYYTLTDQRIPYMRDKTADERYFVLTLFAVAFELAGTDYRKDEIVDVQLAIGLPPAHYGAQYERFENYFLNRDRTGVQFHFRKQGESQWVHLCSNYSSQRSLTERRYYILLNPQQYPPPP